MYVLDTLYLRVQSPEEYRLIICLRNSLLLLFTVATFPFNCFNYLVCVRNCPLYGYGKLLLAHGPNFLSCFGMCVLCRAFSGWLYSTPEDLGENADIALCRLKTDELFISIQEAPLSLVPQLLKLHTENILNFNSQVSCQPVCDLGVRAVQCINGSHALYLLSVNFP